MLLIFFSVSATTKQTIGIEHEAMRTLFVETSAFKEILKKLEAERIVVIYGNPGDGKTTLAYQAMHYLTRVGKRPLEINMHNHIDWDIFTDSSKENLVILIDNIFGEYSVSSERVRQWSYQSRVLQDALSHEERKNYLIITIRSEIYSQCGESITDDSFFNSSRVGISQGCKYGLSDDEMKIIFQKYIPDGSIPKWAWPVQSPPNVQKIGFQLCCRLFKETPNLREIGLRFFANPLPSLKTEVTKGLINGDMNMAILVSILLYGGSVKKCILYDKSIDNELKMTAMKMSSVLDRDLDHFSEAILNLKSSFVVHTIELGEEVIKFSHSSIQSTVFFVTGKHRPEELIRNCHYTLLSMMTTSQCSNIDIESLEVPDYCITDLCYRVRKLLNGRSLSSGLFQVISDFCFWNDSRFFEKFVKFDKLLINSRDETGLSMFVYFSAVGCIKLVKHLFKKIARTSDLRFALKAACGANKLKIIDFLLESNVIPDIECSFNAVKGGHIQSIYKLVNAGIDLTQVSTSQTVWDTTTSVLEEAALQNQCHLLEPLLKLCKNLINIKSSTGATAIHFVASAGDVPLLKKLIDNKTFSPYATSNIGSTILHFATQNNRFDAVEYIIANYPRLVLGKYFCYEYGTILHTAAQSGNCDLFKYVFDKILNILESNKVECIQLEQDCHILINDRRIDNIDRSMILHVKDKSGNTIMHEAAWSRSVQIVQCLIDKGIEVADCVSSSGLNVLDFAKTRNDNNDMIEFLQKHISQRTY